MFNQLKFRPNEVKLFLLRGDWSSSRAPIIIVSLSPAHRVVMCENRSCSNGTAAEHRET